MDSLESSIPPGSQMRGWDMTMLLCLGQILLEKKQET